MSVLFEQFLQNLSNSGLVADADLADAIDSLAPDRRSDARALARRLIDTELLTRFQAKAIYRGRIDRLSIGEYLVLELIGKGGMGKVYKALHRELQRIVALKVLNRDLAENSEFVKRFRREMRAVARLSHPNIVQAYDAGQRRKRLYLAMEYIDGTDLRVLLNSHGTLNVENAVACVIQAARGLAYAHARGVVHRDIKPANLILDDRGVLRILDFGLARLEPEGAPPSEITQSGDVIGSIDFMSPEQMTSTRDADHRSDIYSLGCVLYVLLTAKPVFAGASAMTKLVGHLHSQAPSLHLSVTGAPEQLDHVFQRMVAKNPDDRFQSMSEVLQGLTEVRLDADSPPNTETAASTSQNGTIADAVTAVSIENHVETRRSRRLAQLVRSEPTSTSDSDTARHFDTGPVVASSPGRPKPRLRRPAAWLTLSAIVLAIVGIVFWNSRDAGDDRSNHSDSQAWTTVRIPAEPDWPADASLRVFVLAGQFNMAGRGMIADLHHLAEERVHRGTFGHLKTANNAWVERGDVSILNFSDGTTTSGALTIGFGEESDRFGPELGFGHVVGESFDDPILIVKVTQESFSLAVEGRPPGSGGETGSYYDLILSETSETLDNLGSLFPEHGGRNAVITGFVWFQGWNDSLHPAWVAEYEDNLANLIRDLRREWDAPRLPVVIGEFGPHGRIGSQPRTEVLRRAAQLRAAQRAVATSPEFAGTVAFVETSPYVQKGPGAPSQYGENAETFYMIGEAFGEAMLDLVETSEPPDMEPPRQP